MKRLTKAEEEIMQVLWRLDRAFVKEVIDELPAPKPAYNTVSTIIRILEKKGFVSYESFGKAHRYYPLITKKDYASKFMRGFIADYFGNSLERLVSFFAQEEDMSLEQMDALMKNVRQQLKSKNKSHE